MHLQRFYYSQILWWGLWGCLVSFSSNATTSLDWLEPSKISYLSKDDWQAYINDPMLWLKDIQLIPRYLEDDAMHWEVIRVLPTSPMAQLGFQAGDKVSSINAISVKERLLIINLLQEWSSGGILEIAILRDNQPLMLSVAIE
ncbi:MAG: hypothetical protein AAGB12_01830 [Pseudomonadota bacterium]